jgi:hypothetical protein
MRFFLLIILMALGTEIFQLITGFGSNVDLDEGAARAILIVLPLFLIVLFFFIKQSKISDKLTKREDFNANAGHPEPWSAGVKGTTWTAGIKADTTKSEHSEPNEFTELVESPSTTDDAELDKFKTLLEYDEDARKICDELNDKCGQKFAYIFVEELIAHPDIKYSDAKLKAEHAYNAELHHYADVELTRMYRQIIAIGDDAKSELERVVALVGGRVEKKSVMRKVISKYTQKKTHSANLPSNDLPSHNNNNQPQLTVDQLVDKISCLGYKVRVNSSLYSIVEPLGGRPKPMQQDAFRKYAETVAHELEQYKGATKQKRIDFKIALSQTKFEVSEKIDSSLAKMEVVEIINSALTSFGYSVVKNRAGSFVVNEPLGGKTRPMTIEELRIYALGKIDQEIGKP